MSDLTVVEAVLLCGGPCDAMLLLMAGRPSGVRIPYMPPPVRGQVTWDRNPYMTALVYDRTLDYDDGFVCFRFQGMCN